jgi:hypothetical protein
VSSGAITTVTVLLDQDYEAVLGDWPFVRKILVKDRLNRVPNEAVCELVSAKDMTEAPLTWLGFVIETVEY